MEVKETKKGLSKSEIEDLYLQIKEDPYSDDVWKQTVKKAREEGLQEEGQVTLEELISLGNRVKNTASAEERQEILMEENSTGEIWYDTILGGGNKALFDSIERILKKETESREAKFDKGLEVGSGTGNILSAMSSFFEEVVGVDVSEDMLEVARKKGMPENVELFVGSAENLPFDEEVFDRAVSNGLTHYLSEKQVIKFARELKRVLKQGGIYMEAYPIREEDEKVPEMVRNGLESARDMLELHIAHMFIYGEDEAEPVGMKEQADIFLSEGFDLGIVGPLEDNIYVMRYKKVKEI